MKGLLGVLLGAFFGMGPTAAIAQDESGGFLQVFGGSFHLDGSCVFSDDGTCLSGLPEGGERLLKGLRFGYRSTGRWSAEGTVALDDSGDYQRVRLDQRPGAPFIGKPFLRPGPFNIRLWTVGGTYSLLRRDRFDVYASGAIGRIELERGASTTIRDLVTVVGGGGLVHLWRILFLRGDVRGYGQWCSEERTREGTFCENGSLLGHLEASVGVQLVFHPYATDP